MSNRLLTNAHFSCQIYHLTYVHLHFPIERRSSFSPVKKDYWLMATVFLAKQNSHVIFSVKRTIDIWPNIFRVKWALDFRFFFVSAVRQTIKLWLSFLPIFLLTYGLFPVSETDNLCHFYSQETFDLWSPLPHETDLHRALFCVRNLSLLAISSKTHLWYFAVIAARANVSGNVYISIPQVCDIQLWTQPSNDWSVTHSPHNMPGKTHFHRKAYVLDTICYLCQ